MDILNNHELNTNRAYTEVRGEKRVNGSCKEQNSTDIPKKTSVYYTISSVLNPLTRRYRLFAAVV